jgi:hypothetical protein
MLQLCPGVPSADWQRWQQSADLAVTLTGKSFKISLESYLATGWGSLFFHSNTREIRLEKVPFYLPHLKQQNKQSLALTFSKILSNVSSEEAVQWHWQGQGPQTGIIPRSRSAPYIINDHILRHWTGKHIYSDAAQLIDMPSKTQTASHQKSSDEDHPREYASSSSVQESIFFSLRQLKIFVFALSHLVICECKIETTYHKNLCWVFHSGNAVKTIHRISLVPSFGSDTDFTQMLPKSTYLPIQYVLGTSVFKKVTALCSQRDDIPVEKN